METNNDLLSIDGMNKLGFSCIMTRRGNATHTYTMTKPKDIEWPDNKSLINFCDNGSCNFGGSVSIRSDTTAVVMVYID